MRPGRPLPRLVRVEIDGELGRGPSGTSVREGRAAINDDFDSNPCTRPWRAAALEYGLRASASFPLQRQGRVVGSLTLYAKRPGTFTPRHVVLLEALCADVSYALDAMEHERQRAEAERALRESERALREADRRKEEFLGMLSHELRNPLTPIRNSSYVLRHAQPGSEQARRAQTVIERQTEHMARLVDDLLDVTRIARGKMELRRSHVDLREIILRAADDYRVLTDQRGLALRVTVPDAAVWVEADAARVTQVAGNLLHNAAKFTQRGGEVALGLAVADGAAVISVRDTGVGIDPDLVPQLFDAFVQGQQTLARTEGGLGLGLALVKGITQLHGGTVSAKSAGIGMGAEFTVRLRLASSPAETSPPTLAPVRGTRRKVLVVEDNRDAADSLKELIEMLGHAAEVAYDGRTAVEKARASRPDVVLCDIGLPGMSGYEVAQAIRADGTNGARLIAVTGYTQAEDVKRAIEAGFDGHVAKPPEIAQIERLLS